MIYVLIILVLIFIMPVKIVISKNDKRSDVDIFFTKLFDVRLDFDELLKYLLTTKEDRAHITFDSIIHNLGVFKRSKNIFVSILKMSRINKLTLIIKTRSANLETDTYGYVFTWIFLCYLKKYVHEYFKKVENDYYNHQLAEQYNVNLDCHINIRLIYIIFAVIRNIKDIPRVLKFIKKGSKVYGASNI